MDYPEIVLEKTRKTAIENREKNISYIKSICQEFNITETHIADKLLSKPITLNFHPDRLCGSGKIILDSLFDDAKYQGQFITKTTNGGATAYVGGQRYNWEQELFFNSYPHNYFDRPKYGALNILNYLDGATPRFGSCYFVLSRSLVERCTFAYGDSSANPKGLCTSDTFDELIVKIIEDIQSNERILNKSTSSIQEGLAVLFYNSKRNFLGRCLDHYIETHVHGDISLETDVDEFYIDESYKDTLIEVKAKKLCDKYDIVLKYIPKREIQINDINDLFRGEKIRPLAERIDTLFGEGNGVINAYLIGEASRYDKSGWIDIGSKAELFQYLKQLWHTVAYFG